MEILLDGDEKEENSVGTAVVNVVGAVVPNDSLFPALSFKTRFYGFVACAGIGICLSVLGTIMLIFFSTKIFSILYSLGNLCTLCSTGFLIGPWKQVQQMTDPNRLIATIVFFLALGTTLAIALTNGNAGLCMLCVIIQMCAFVWYSISYIPFAREFVISVGSTIMSDENDRPIISI